MKHLRHLLPLLIFPLLVAACAGGESDVPVTQQSPALIMFYTDN